MNAVEKIRIGVAFFGIAVGGGLIKRGHPWLGIPLILAGSGSAVISLADDQYRPMLAIVCLLGVSYGLKWDEDGRRVIGLTGVSIGFVALLAGMMVR